MLFLSLSIKSVVLRRNITIAEMICAGDLVFQTHGPDSPFPLLILMANRRPHCVECDNLETVLMKRRDGKPSLYTSAVPEGHNVVPIVDWQAALPADIWQSGNDEPAANSRSASVKGALKRSRLMKNTSSISSHCTGSGITVVEAVFSIKSDNPAHSQCGKLPVDRQHAAIQEEAAVHRLRRCSSRIYSSTPRSARTSEN